MKRHPIRSAGASWIFWIAAFAVFHCASVCALDRDRSIAQFHHTSWTIKDGAPADIWALAQTADGYLWLGTGNGLYRFDGVRFERFEPLPGEAFRSNNITALQVLPSGALWIGFYFGGASVLKDGHLTHYTEREGLPSSTVYRFARDQDGALWAAIGDGLARFDGTRWQRVGRDWGYPGPGANWVFVDRRGTLWVSSGETLLFLRKGSHAFEDSGEPAGVSVIDEAPDGRIWISDDEHGTRALPDLQAKTQPARAAIPPAGTDFVRAKRMLFDRDGTLWATDAIRGGLFRLPVPERFESGHIVRPEDVTDVFTQKDGLTTNVAVPLLEDREGNIWVGTNLGLNRFRHSTIVVEHTVPAMSSLGFALVADEHGAVWVATNNQLMHIGQRSSQVIADALPAISCAYRGADGVLWLGGPDGVEHMENNALVRTALPAGAGRAYVLAMTQDRTGKLWVSLDQRGLFSLDHGVWTAFDQQAALPGLTARSAATDALGRIWLGYADGRVARLDNGTLRTFAADDGLHVGSIATIAIGAPDLLVGGEFGLALFDGGRFRSLTTTRLKALSEISGIVETPAGDIWLNGGLGVVHTSSAELHHALDDANYHLPYQRFDFEDGLPGIAQQVSGEPTAIAGTDGRVWFATNHGVAWIDPTRIVKNTVPPPVSIRALRADGKTWPPTPRLTLPARPTNVEIDYTALSLTMPERVRFHYRLDGLDDTWQDVGTRREAYYTYLAPGHYRFHVIAANNDGVWNDVGAAVDFTVPPTFLQTKGFLALCALAVIGVLWLLYLLRLRQMAARIRGLMEERVMERERIARELHDTFLQGLQGLILRFHAASERIPEHEPAHSMMERALERADQVLVEGRDRVKDLRASTETRNDLAQAFIRVGAELAPDHPAAFRVVVEGTPRDLHPIVRDEVYHIGREAIINAFHHAQASVIEVELTYDVGDLRLRVRDNGCGIEPAILASGRRPGHWGLAGMRERASKIDAHLDIWSRPGSGTEIELRLCAAVAYRTAVSRFSPQWLLRFLHPGT